MDEETRGLLTAGREKLLTVVISGQIEGHTKVPPEVKSTAYESLLPRLVLADEDPEVDGVLFLLNTVGGDVEAGLAMAELIAGMQTPTASLVLGGGHSIGIPLAVAADRCFLAPSATMTVHPVRIGGPVLSAPQSFEYLQKIQDRIEDFILRHSRTSPETLRAWMQGRSDMATDIGSVLLAREAVAGGLADGVGSLSETLADLKGRIEAKKAL